VARRLHCAGQTDLQSDIGPDLVVEGRARVAVCEVERGREACAVQGDRHAVAGQRGDDADLIAEAEQTRCIRIRPCKPSTIRCRRATLIAAIRTAVRIGISLEQLSSLRALLNPDVVEQIIGAYWKKDEEEPKIFTIDLGTLLLYMARETGCVDAPSLERLGDFQAQLEEYRRGGLTDKNLKSSGRC
jgi:hypothetical protein